MKTALVTLLFSLSLAAPAQAGVPASPDAPVASIAARGNGRILSLFVPAAQAQALLPAGIELAPAAEFPAGLHLISIIVAEHRNFRLQAPVASPFGGYQELVVAVNHVRKVGGQAIFWYFQQIYVDSVPAWMGGRYFGYQKFLGSFSSTDSSMEVWNDQGQRLLKAEWAPTTDFDPALFRMQTALMQREVSYPVIGKLMGRDVCTEFTWHFDTAAVAPLVSHWDITDAFLPSLAGSVEAVATGALAVSSSLDADWELAGPYECAP